MKNISARLIGFALAATISIPASADVLRIATLGEATSIDPHFQTQLPIRQITTSIFDQLIDQDQKQNLAPSLAISWKTIDELTWEIKLRDGVKWQDGSPFTADDVVFSFERIPTVKGSIGNFSAYVAGKRATKVDDLTVRIKTDVPTPLLLRDISVFGIVSKKHADGKTTDDFNTGKATIGTGPYKFVEWVRGDRIVLESNPSHWARKPDWDRVIYKPIGSGPSRVAALLNGDVDLIDNVPPQDAKRLETDPKFSLHVQPSARIQVLWPDTGRDLSPFVTNETGTPLFPNPLRDQRVRKAMSMAIDRSILVERMLMGLAAPDSQIMLPGTYGYNPDLKPERYDPDGAKKLLAEAGYADKITVTVHVRPDRNVNAVQIVEAVAQMWHRVGIKTKIEVMPDSVFAPKAQRRELSMFYQGWGMTTGDPSSPMREAFHTRNPTAGWGGFNFSRYSNDRLDSKIEEALSTIDEVKREKLFQESIAIAVNDLVWIPLLHEMNIWASRKGIKYEARADAMTLAKSAFMAK